MDHAVIALLRKNRLDHHANKLLELGVQRLEDLADLLECDLEGFTVVEKRRFLRIAHPSDASTVEAEGDSESVASDSTSSWLSVVSQSGEATVVVPRAERPALFGAMHDELSSGTSDEDSGITVRYCTVQPLTARRKTKSVPFLNPHVCTLRQLVDLICEQEQLPGNLTAQLYMIDGVPLSRNPVTECLTLSEWHIDDGSFFWVIFHSIDVEDDIESPESMPELDPTSGLTQIFVRRSKTITIMVDLAQDDGQTLRRKIYSKTKVPTSVIGMSYAGKPVLNNCSKLQDYNIEKGSTLHMWIAPKRVASGWESVFQAKRCHPIVQQTAAGMSSFNACLRVLGDVTVKLADVALLGYIRHTTQCPPLVLALNCLFEKKLLTKAHKVALHECLYWLFRMIVPTNPNWVPPNTSASDNSVFEHSVLCWSHLHAKACANPKFATGETYTAISLTCPISNELLKHPVRYRGSTSVFDRASVEKKLNQGSSIPGLPAGEVYTMDDFTVDSRTAQLVLACSGEREVLVWDAPDGFTPETLPTPAKPVPPDAYSAICSAVLPQLKVHSPLNLKEHGTTFPCLTVNAKNMIIVCTGNSKAVGSSFYLYDPWVGNDDMCDVDVLAAKLSTNVQLPQPTFKKEGVISRPPKEAIVVILDRSRSMKASSFDKLKRIHVVKELFKTFADRSMAYNYHHVIGLTVFSKSVEVISFVSEAFVHFQAALQDVDHDIGTAIWDAMVSAAEQLDVISSNYPDCVKRILCLTDGEDNSSTNEPHKVAKLLQEKNIVLDCVLVGKGNSTAKAIAVATNGCAFFPSDHRESLRLFQMETVLSIRERLVGQRKPSVTSRADLKTYEDSQSYPFDTMPQRVMPGELNNPVTSTKRVLRRASLSPPKGLAAPSLKRTKRILVEVAEYQRDPHPSIHVYPCERQLDFWRVLLVAPSDTPYEGGVFLLYAKFPTDYPQVAPEIRFVTPIYHCNVNGHGKICHSVFDRNYSTDFSVRHIMDCVFGLLLEPEPEDPLDSALAEEYFMNRTEYDFAAAANVRQHAKKSLDAWQKELLGAEAVEGDIPSHLACAWSGKLMKDPVSTPSEHTYEREVIERLLEQEEKDPLTGVPLTKAQLYPVKALREAIGEYKRAQEQMAWYLA